jgi:hypothetical protein
LYCNLTVLPKYLEEQRPAGGNMNMGHFYGKVVDANKKGIDGITIQLKSNKFDPATKKTTEVVVGTMISATNGDF